jgi:hypothetical protein
VLTFAQHLLTEDSASCDAQPQYKIRRNGALPDLAANAIGAKVFACHA